MDPVGYEGTAPHRQKRLGNTDQVSKSAAGVSSHIPLESGPVTSCENNRFHFYSSGATTIMYVDRVRNSDFLS